MISVLYFGARASSFSMWAFWAAALRVGGGPVRVGTGSPAWVKNSSWPAGETRQSIRAGLVETFLNACGALAGMLTVVPAAAADVWPRKSSSISPSRM